MAESIVPVDVACTCIFVSFLSLGPRLHYSGSSASYGPVVSPCNVVTGSETKALSYAVFFCMVLTTMHP